MASSQRLSAVVGRLTVVNVLASATGFITGPLLARALGADGRGDLAAILVPLALAPHILGLGLPGYVNREAARGRPLDELFGSVAVPLVGIGIVGAAAAFPIAGALAQGRETVRVCLLVVFLALPFFLIGTMLFAAVQGLERWSRMIAARLIVFGLPFVAISVLYVLGELTVATAGGITIFAGLVAFLPVVSLLFERGRLVFRASIAREGLGFGLRSWVGGLALLANMRVDQLVMITAVAPRELGLYAVATTVAGASALLTGAVTPPLIARVAAGQVELVPRALRITLVATAAINVVLAAATPLLLLVLFGREFTSATAMTFVLLAAALPLAGASVLSAGLQADGRPGIPSLAEALALILTFAGLAVALKPLGGLGAAIVSLVAYSASFLFQLVVAHRRGSVPLRAYLLPSRADVRWARELAGPALRRRRVGG